MIKKRILSTVCAFVMGTSCFAGMQGAFSSDEVGITASAATTTVDLPVTRISGSNRFATAAAVSKKAYPNGTENVILASDSNYADALCGSPLAKALNAPILLSAKELLPNATKTEMTRLGVKNVYILGGTAVIDETIEKQLAETGLNVVRIAGEDRYGTSSEVARCLQQMSGKPSLTAFFVSANDYPDAISVSSIAAIKDSPIFYVDKSGKLDEKVKDYLANCGRKLGFAYIIGGTSAISDDILEEIKPYFNQSGRYGGDNRYDTNAYINTAFRTSFTGTDIYLATGKDFPDALTGGVLAAKNGSPIAMADTVLTAKQTEYFKNYGVTEAKGNSLDILGGEAAVSRTTTKAVLLYEDPALTVTDNGTSATLKWAKNSFITSYQVYRDSELITTVTDPFKTSYTDKEISKNSSYRYRVVYNFKMKGQKYVLDASAEIKRKAPEYSAIMTKENTARLNSEKNNTPKSSFMTENAQGATSTYSYYDIKMLTTNDWATLDKFAKEHFTSSMTKAEKVAYTLNWINKNVWYGTVADGGWAKIMAMVQNGTFSYVNCIFNNKIGQCNCYNGALVSMMLYLGYDAHLVCGYRGRTNENGVDRGGSNHWQHFWGEVKINGQIYVMEAGNYGEDGDWMHLCEPYKDVEGRYEYTENGQKKTGWHGYLKNGKIAL